MTEQTELFEPHLSEENHMLVPKEVFILRSCQGKEQAKTQQDVCNVLAGEWSVIINPRRLRVIVHYIRIKKVLPLLVGDKYGLYIDNDREKLLNWAKMKERKVRSELEAVLAVKEEALKLPVKETVIKN
jgi:hypothetical protein